MSFYEYRVVPAPVAAPRVKGVKGTSNLFALGLEEALNAEGQDAWEYQRSETLTASSRQGLFRKTVTEQVTVMIYRRWVETEEAYVPEAAETSFDTGRDTARQAPQTPETLVAELPPRDAAQDISRPGGSTTAGDGARPAPISANRRPEGALRPVPGAARD